MSIEGTHQGVHTKEQGLLSLGTPHYLTGWPYQAAERLNCAIELRGDTGRSHEIKIWVEMLIHTPEHLLITW